MKIVLIYRQSCKGAYSIEGLFHTVANELSGREEVVEYTVGSRWRVLFDAWQLRKLEADIYHVTGDINFFVNLLPKGKTVLTIHDLGNFIFGLGGVKKLLYKWFWFSIPMKSAGAITVVSDQTADKITEHFHIGKERLKMINNCYSSNLRYSPKPFDEKKPTILQVGTGPHKNVPRLIEALRGVSCKLVIIGHINDDLFELLQMFAIDYENNIDLTAEQLVEKYCECDIVSFISLHEGFGLPIIEANVVGRPLITSNIAPMPEVAGASAVVVNPYDVGDIRNAILQVCKDNKLREHLVANGTHNAARYAPSKIAGKYLHVYKTLSAS